MDNISKKQILDKEKIICSLEDKTSMIDSIFTFKDHDFLLFKSTFSILYDGEILKEKLNLNFIGSSNAFCYLSENEFLVMKNNYFSLYKFKNNRTSYEIITTVQCSPNEENKKIFKIFKNDILNICEYKFQFQPSIKIYTRIDDNNGSTINYELISDNVLTDIDEVINLEDTFQFLAFKKYENLNEILFKVYDYGHNIVRFNRVNCFSSKKRRIFMPQFSFYKVNKNKLITSSIYYIYIFDIETLELETTIKVFSEIKRFIILNNRNIMLVLYNSEFKDLKREEHYSICKMLVDFENNSIEKTENNEITDKVGEFKTLFNIFNYHDDGLITISDHCFLNIYKDICKE
jgi:hypothetical protein